MKRRRTAKWNTSSETRPAGATWINTSITDGKLARYRPTLVILILLYTTTTVPRGECHSTTAEPGRPPTVAAVLDPPPLPPDPRPPGGRPPTTMLAATAVPAQQDGNIDDDGDGETIIHGMHSLDVVVEPPTTPPRSTTTQSAIRTTMTSRAIPTGGDSSPSRRPSSTTFSTSSRPSSTTMSSSSSTRLGTSSTKTSRKSTTTTTTTSTDSSDDEDDDGRSRLSSSSSSLATQPQGGPGGFPGRGPPDGHGPGEGGPGGQRNRRNTGRGRGRRDPRPESTQIVKTLNKLRRSLAGTGLAADMYYASWDAGLERVVADVTSSSNCNPPSSTKIYQDVQVQDARGFIGFLSPVHNIADALEHIVYKHHGDPFYSMLMSSHMLSFGCDVSKSGCPVTDAKPNQTIRMDIFACVFTYFRRPVLPTPGVNCSQCESVNNALWCDAGLCRGCALGDESCDTECLSTCSDCRRVTSVSRCQCLCYYETGPPRCPDDTGRPSPEHPICRSRPPAMKPETILGISVAIGITFTLTIVTVIVACCVRRARVDRRQSESRQRRVSPATNAPPDVSGQEVHDVIDPASCQIITPPPYDDVANDPKPPPYSAVPVFPVLPCPSYDATVTGETYTPPLTPTDIMATGTRLGNYAAVANVYSELPPVVETSCVRTNLPDVTVAFCNNVVPSAPPPDTLRQTAQNDGVV